MKTPNALVGFTITGLVGLSFAAEPIEAAYDFNACLFEPRLSRCRMNEHPEQGGGLPPGQERVQIVSGTGSGQAILSHGIVYWPKGHG